MSLMNAVCQVPTMPWRFEYRHHIVLCFALTHFMQQEADSAEQLASIDDKIKAHDHRFSKIEAELTTVSKKIDEFVDL
jgi:hypothetical protein